MKTTEFIERLATRLDISREEAHRVYHTFVGVAKDALSRGEEVRLESLGKLVSTLGSTAQGRPHRAERREHQMMTVTFEQFRSSRTELVAMSPFAKDVARAGFAQQLPDAEPDDEESGSVDGGPPFVRNEPDADE